MEEAGAAYRQWLPLVPVLWLRDAAVAKAAERVANRARGSRVRRAGALAGAGMVLIVAAGLVAADLVDAPVRAARASAPVARVTAVVTPAPQPVVVHRPRRHRAPRLVATPTPQATPTPTPVAVAEHAVPAAPTATPTPEPPRRVTTRTRPKADEAELAPAEPEPVVVEEPPPPPPRDPDPDPPPPIACPNCPIVGGAPPVP
jgi:hypothetical protein